MAKQPSFLKRIDPELWGVWDEKIRDKFFFNVPTKIAVDVSEMKLDEKRPWPKYDRNKEIALSYVDRILEPALTQQAYTEQQTYDAMDLKKTVSFPWRFLGFKSRSEFFKSPLWLSIKDDPQAMRDYGMIYKSCPKEEWSDIADWDGQKTRTFLIPGAHVLFWQNRLFGPANNALKNYEWSKYGFNPFNGNVNKLVKEMQFRDKNGKLSRPVRIWWDISGYDRKINLYDVANRRYKFFMNLPQNMPYQEMMKWICDGLRESVIILSNGDIVMRHRGNNSGSGATTTNNIEAGFEVLTDLLIAAYYRKFGDLPSFQHVFEQLVHLYGDDNLCILSDDFEYIMDNAFLEDRLLNYHGLKLKLYGGGIEQPFQELSFLGFNFAPFRDFWIPKWNLNRLLVPLVYSKEHLNLGVFVQRFYAITLLSFAHDEWSDIRNAYIKVLNWCMVNSGDPYVKSLVRLGVPSEQQMVHFYLGLESGDGWPNISVMEKLSNEQWTQPELGPDYDKQANYKGILLDLLAKKRIAAPQFVTDMTGPTNNATFFTHALFDDHLFTCYGTTKKEGEQHVAYKIYTYFNAKKKPLAQVNESRGRVEPSREPVSRENNQQWYTFFSTLIRDVRSYVDTPIDERMYHPLSTLLDESDLAAAKLLTERLRVGSFNPYGNGQTAGVMHAENDILRWAYNTHQQFMTPLYCPCLYCNALRETMETDTCSVEYEKTPHIVYSPNRTRFMGSFNPYGNGQFDNKFTLQRPTTKTVGGIVTCSSTCLLPDAVNVIGSGTDGPSAFSDWHDQINVYIDSWVPPSSGVPLEIFKLLRQGSRPKDGSFLFVWDENEDTAYRKFYQKFKEGGFNPYGNGQHGYVQTFFEGFNPYGNGQPGPMKKGQWITANKTRLAKLSSSEIDAMYQTYVKKKNSGTSKKPKPSSPTAGPMRRGKNPNPKTGYEKRAEIKLSGCAKSYAAALTCPFWWQDKTSDDRVRSLKIDGENPCIPNFPAVKSRKFYGRAKGTLGISSPNGVGFLFFAPWRLMNDPNVTNDVDPAVIFSTSSVAWSSEAFPRCDTGNPLTVGGAGFNTDYTKADLLVNSAGVGITYRVVAAGVRIRYIGSELQKSGFYVGVTEPNHHSLSLLTLTEIGQFDTYYSYSMHESSKRNKDGWFEVCHTPVQTGDYEYQADAVSNATWGDDSYNHYMGMMIIGAPPGDSFQWEAIGHFEAVGAKVTSKTPTACDPIGTSLVNTAITAEKMKETVNTSTPVKGILKENTGDITTTGLTNVIAPIMKVAETMMPMVT